MTVIRELQVRGVRLDRLTVADRNLARYRKGYPKAVEILLRDWDRMVEFSKNLKNKKQDFIVWKNINLSQ